MLKQTEGSHAVAEAVALCRPEVICAYPISPQTHIVEGARRNGEVRRVDRLRVHQRRIRIRRHERRHRLVGHRCPHLHGHRLAGPAVHGRGGLQRLRPRPADRHDGGQPRHRRADQHLERPFRFALAARLRLDPALRRNQPGSARPAHPGLQAGRGARRCR